jgi:hypothetical protein
MPQGGVEILLKEINRLHDVHIAIDEPISLFHIALLPPLIFALPSATGLGTAISALYLRLRQLFSRLK